jgi:hypothetical protein
MREILAEKDLLRPECRRDARNERRTAQSYFCCHLSRIGIEIGRRQGGKDNVALSSGREVRFRTQPLHA